MKKTIRWIILGFTILLAACSPTTTATPDLTLAPSPPANTPVAEIPTAEPVRTLTVCLAQEPASLYYYGDASTAALTVYEAVYDGPIDIKHYEALPVILNKMPAMADGDAQLQPVVVAAGQPVIDAQGDLVNLVQGTQVYPAGCNDDSCAITWDGQSGLSLDQLTLTFQMLPGLKWSDGEPLTASDSVYSYQLAADPATPANRYYIDRTDSYQTVDAVTVQWIGVPGYTHPDYASLFWTPLPQHVWAKYSAAELLTAEDSSQKPLGWGAYQIDEWIKGDQIVLSRNPEYFRAAEGYPKFDQLIFKFNGSQADNNITAVVNGRCDLIDPGVDLTSQMEDIINWSNEGRFKMAVGLGPEWDHVDFGILPASYDDGYQPETDRPDYFGDLRMREALTMCMDRQTIIQKYLYNRSLIPVSFYAPDHPTGAASLTPIGYDPQAGASLLDEMGWKDTDQNPATPRVAEGVQNVPDGTQLILNYVTTDSVLRQQVAAELKTSMSACGVQLNLNTLTPGAMYAAGPDGVLFGRNFDLAQFSWKTGSSSPCFIYTSEQIPTVDNLWVGANVTGFSDPDYDASCKAVQQSSSQDENYLEIQAQNQQAFNQSLPVVPLYYQVKLIIARKDFCDLSYDTSARTALSDLETMDYGPDCLGQ